MENMYHGKNGQKILDLLYKDIYDYESLMSRGARKDYKNLKLRKKLQEIANHFSVCLYKEGEFLSLGDLENDDINPCISHFLITHNLEEVNVKYFITPHHGTHWNTECEKIKADYVISSNGSQRIKKFVYSYINCLKANSATTSNCSYQNIHNTYCMGDFVN